MGFDAFLYGVAGRDDTSASQLGLVLGVYGYRNIGQRADFAGSGRSNTGGFVPVAPAGCLAVYLAASEWVFIAFADMFAMDDFSDNGN